MIGAAPGLFFATDREGRLIRWNAAAEQFAGLDTAGIAGTDTLSLVLEEDRLIAAAAIREAMEAGASQDQLRLEGTQGVRDALITTRRTDIGGAPVSVSDIERDPSYGPWREQALARGYRSALSLPLTDPRGVTWGVLCLFAGETGAFDDREVALLEELALDLSFGVESIGVRAKRDEGELRTSYVRLEHMMRDMVGAMGRIVEARDPYTQGHERRVAELAQALAAEMGMDDDSIAMVQMTSLLHDIGKLAVPAEILTKAGTLSDSEFEMIKDHSRQGYEILKEITFPWPIADIVLQHHERMDGSGYPSGLKGDQILLPARIIAVADVVEAMASHRPYRPIIGLGQALQALSEGTGMFDPDVVAACERLYAKGEIRL
ncbi:MAG TPA: HD domain-containing phosphohydrolase [Coriobacteriia bacterium]